MKRSLIVSRCLVAIVASMALSAQVTDKTDYVDSNGVRIANVLVFEKQ